MKKEKCLARGARLKGGKRKMSNLQKMIAEEKAGVKTREALLRKVG